MLNPTIFNNCKHGFEGRIRNKILMRWIIKKLVGCCYEEHSLKYIESMDIKIKLNKSKSGINLLKEDLIKELKQNGTKNKNI